MLSLTSIYETLNQNDEFLRHMQNINQQEHYTPWNSLDINKKQEKKYKNDIRNNNSFLKISRRKNKSQSDSNSKRTQSLKRTSYCFQTEYYLNKDQYYLRRNSTENNKIIDKLPQLSSRIEQRRKIKSFNDQQKLKKDAILSKLSGKQQQQFPDSYKTMIISKFKNGIQLRSKNIQMIRHISQRKMCLL